MSELRLALRLGLSLGSAKMSSSSSLRGLLEDGFPAGLLARIASSWDRIGLWPDDLPGGTFSTCDPFVPVFERSNAGF